MSNPGVQTASHLGLAAETLTAMRTEPAIVPPPALKPRQSSARTR